MALISSQTKRLIIPESFGFGPNEWVELKTVLTAGMRRRVMSRSMHVSLNNFGGADVSAAMDDVDLFGYRTALIEEVVVAWSDPAPLSPEALEDLPAPLQDWLAEQFDALVAGRTAEQTAFLDAPSPNGSVATENSASLVSLVT